ncbi:hypothetical protein C8R44DRAFT_745756 [Mycena epipterygia]|nr:hypothetical protein C8R44DRAFT_745756 [Mycena epipterygia]
MVRLMDVLRAQTTLGRGSAEFKHSLLPTSTIPPSFPNSPPTSPYAACSLLGDCTQPSKRMWPNRQQTRLSRNHSPLLSSQTLKKCSNYYPLRNWMTAARATPRSTSLCAIASLISLVFSSKAFTVLLQPSTPALHIRVPPAAAATHAASATNELPGAIACLVLLFAQMYTSTT